MTAKGSPEALLIIVAYASTGWLLVNSSQRFVSVVPATPGKSPLSSATWLNPLAGSGPIVPVDRRAPPPCRTLIVAVAAALPGFMNTRFVRYPELELELTASCPITPAPSAWDTAMAGSHCPDTAPEPQAFTLFTFAATRIGPVASNRIGPRSQVAFDNILQSVFGRTLGQGAYGPIWNGLAGDVVDVL